jgi:hypothetical protein
VYDNEVYGGQIQLWKKGEKGQKTWMRLWYSKFFQTIKIHYTREQD